MALPSKSKIGTQVTVSFSDSIRLIRDQVDWTPQGVRLLTKWHFGEGTEVEFAFDHKGERHCCVGIVVGCRPLRQPAGFFETVLFFIETPCTRLQKAACDCRLARAGHIPRDEIHFTVTGQSRTPARSRSTAHQRDGLG
jgi:hypothetical protein